MTPVEVANAACRDMPDPDLMAAVEYPLMVRQAREVCARCPLRIRRACLDEGLAIRDAFMIRAGTTPAQRAAFDSSYLHRMINNPARFLASSTARNPATILASAA